MGEYSQGSNMDKLSEEELEKAANKELGEDKQRLKSDIEALKEWISKTPHLKGIRQDDAQLLKFLMRPGKLDPTQPNILEESFITSLAFFELVCENNPQAQVKGIVVLHDVGEATAQHARMMNPVIAKKGLTIFEEAYPARPKAMHFLNFPPVMQGVFTMMQGFLTEKMRKRNQVHQKGDYVKLYEEIGKDVLPEEYGGSNGSVKDIQNDWMKRVLENKDWFAEQTQYKSDESKRPGKPKSHADIFGIEGSFRKLDID